MIFKRALNDIHMCIAIEETKELVLSFGDIAKRSDMSDSKKFFQAESYLKSILDLITDAVGGYYDGDKLKVFTALVSDIIINKDSVYPEDLVTRVLLMREHLFKAGFIGVYKLTSSAICHVCNKQVSTFLKCDDIEAANGSGLYKHIYTYMCSECSSPIATPHQGPLNYYRVD